MNPLRFVKRGFLAMLLILVLPAPAQTYTDTPLLMEEISDGDFFSDDGIEAQFWFVGSNGKQLDSFLPFEVFDPSKPEYRYGIEFTEIDELINITASFSFTWREEFGPGLGSGFGSPAEQLSYEVFKSATEETAPRYFERGSVSFPVSVTPDEQKYYDIELTVVVDLFGTVGGETVERTYYVHFDYRLIIFGPLKTEWLQYRYWIVTHPVISILVGFILITILGGYLVKWIRQPREHKPDHHDDSLTGWL